MSTIAIDWTFDDSWLKELIRKYGLLLPIYLPSNGLLKIPPSLGAGYIRHLEIEADKLTALFCNCTLEDSIAFQWKPKRSMKFYRLYFEFSNVVISKQVLYAEENGIQHVFTSSFTPLAPYVPGTMNIDGVSIIFSDEYLAEIIHEYLDDDVFEKCMCFFQGDDFIVDFAIDKEMLMILEETRQIINHPDNYQFQKLYVKGNILRLLSIFFENILHRNEKNTHFESEDIRRLITFDTELAIKEYEYIPSLEDACRLVSMSATKFKNLFKFFFKDSYYQYYKNKRLLKAMEMLSNRKHNIKEIALKTGYKSTSHFSKAFQKKFSKLPSTLKG